MARKYGVTYTTGRTRKGGDPNAVKSFSINIPTGKGMIRKPKRRRAYVSDTESAVMGFIYLFFIFIPLFAFLVYAFPKFFSVMFCIFVPIILFKVIKKFHEDL